MGERSCMEQIIGIDFTDGRLVDCSAVSCMCGHCRTIIATRTYSPDMNEVNVPFFIKCPHCGVKFTRRVFAEDR